MAWTAPAIVEVCVGMEVTAYSSAEIWFCTPLRKNRSAIGLNRAAKKARVKRLSSTARFPFWTASGAGRSRGCAISRS